MKIKAKSQIRPKDREETERRLLKAAKEVFAEKGFEGATTRMIAERAGTNLGLISRYFKNKRGLLISVLEESWKEAVVALPYPPEKTLQAELNKYAEFCIEMSATEEPFMRITMMQALTDKTLIQEVFKKPSLKALGITSTRFANPDNVQRFAKHLKKDAVKNYSEIHDFVATLDYLIMGAYLTHVVFANESMESCLSHIQASFRNFKIS